MADALDSGSSECKFMRVQVPSPAPKRQTSISCLSFCLDKLNCIYDIIENNWCKKMLL